MAELVTSVYERRDLRCSQSPMNDKPLLLLKCEVLPISYDAAKAGLRLEWEHQSGSVSTIPRVSACFRLLSTQAGLIGYLITLKANPLARHSLHLHMLTYQRLNQKKMPKNAGFHPILRTSRLSTARLAILTQTPPSKPDAAVPKR